LSSSSKQIDFYEKREGISRYDSSGYRWSLWYYHGWTAAAAVRGAGGIERRRRGKGSSGFHRLRSFFT